MRRRDFINGIAGAFAAPLTASAQEASLLGFLGSDSLAQYENRLQALRRGLTEAGYVEGRNLKIEYRWAEGRNDKLPELASDLVRRQVAVVVTSSTPAALALKATTKTIPVVFFVAGDPIALGLVASLNRPGSNFTGTTTLTLAVGSKWLQLMHELVPTATSFALLVNPTSPDLAAAQTKDLQAAASALGLKIQVLRASNDRELDSVFSGFGDVHVGGLVISSDSFFFARSERLASLAIQHAVPAVFGFREFPAAGGLMSYGADVTEQHRILGIYAGRILRGEKPADLPVQQATKVSLAVNLKAAKALGIAVPPALLLRADDVIE